MPARVIREKPGTAERKNRGGSFLDRGAPETRHERLLRYQEEEHERDGNQKRARRKNREFVLLVAHEPEKPDRKKIPDLTKNAVTP